MSWSDKLASMLFIIVAIVAVAGGAAAIAILVQIFRRGGWKLAEPSVRSARWQMVRPWLLAGAVIGLLSGIAIVYYTGWKSPRLPLQRMSSPQRPPKSNLDPVTADRPRSDALPFSTPTRPEPIRLIKGTRDV